MDCCTQLSELQATEPGNFGVLVGTDWYDGVIEGLFVCNQCGKSYWGIMVDWSKDHSVRVFALQEVSDDLAQEMISVVGPMREEVIWMSRAGSHPNPLLEDIEKRVAVDISKPSERRGSFVAAWNIDSKLLIKARSLPQPLRKHIVSWFDDSNVPPLDWFDYLSISRIP